MDVVQKPSTINIFSKTVEQEPVCSICIANYNGQDILTDCLNSVYSQQCKFPFEVILHDDASTDDSLDLVRKNYPQTLIIESESNVGFCISNNRIVNQARGRYILLLNNDAALHPDALQTLLNHAQKQSSQGILTLPQYDWHTGDLVDRGCLLDPFFNPVPNLDPERLDVAMAIGACLWLPRSLWHQLGGFPEWMESIAEDMYLCCLARLQGYPIQVTADSGYLHWQGMSFSGERTGKNKLVTTYRRRALSERNKTLTMLITSPIGFLVFIFPLHLIVIASEGLVISLFTRDIRIFLKVYLILPLSIFKNRKQISELRCRIQRNIHISTFAFLSQFCLLPYKLWMLFRFGFPQVY